LTTSELDTLMRLWRLAGLAPTTGYETAILAMAVASNHPLAAALTSPRPRRHRPDPEDGVKRIRGKEPPSAADVPE
jgi:hypothetical protein